MIQFQENTHTIVRKNVKTLFHKVLSASARGLTNTITVEWHLKLVSAITKQLVLQNKFKKIPFFVIYYLTKFNDVT